MNDPHEFEDYLRLTLSSDRSSASLTLEPGFTPEFLNHERLVAFLNTKAVSRSFIDTSGIDELVRLGLENPAVAHSVRVCAGQPPEPGVDGHFAFEESIQTRVDQVKHREALLKHRLKPMARNHNASEQGADHDPSSSGMDDHVDFYSQSAFVIVHSGDELGRLMPPTPGADGTDVFGENIPVRPGRAADFNIDKSVCVAEDGRVTAGHSGRLIPSFDGVRVEHTLQINSPVSFITGNIDFPGDVNISMGVKDRFVVKSTGNVSIRELVQACTIDCDGDLHLVAGIAGRETAKIRVGGDLSARYIEACSGEVSGSTTISGEITNCSIRFEGDLISPTCSIRGGEVSIAGKVDIATLGSENGTHTVVHAGSLAELDQLLNTALEIGPSLVNAANRIHARIGSALGFEIKDDHLKTMLHSLQEQHLASRTNLGRLADAADRILDLAKQRTRVHFMVRKAIHPGSMITFKGWRVDFEHRVAGPILITLDHTGHPVVTAPGETTPGPMARFARVVEDPTSPRLELIRARIEEMRRPDSQEHTPSPSPADARPPHVSRADAA